MHTMFDRLTSEELKYLQNPELRRQRLAALQKLRRVFFWLVIVTAAVPLVSTVVLMILLKKPIYAPAPAWFIAALNVLAFHRVEREVRNLLLLETLPQPGVALDFTV